MYSSGSIALAALEVLVHLDKSEIPEDYVVMALRFVRKPMAVESDLSGARLLQPAEFRQRYYWTPVLQVPSVIVPREHNYLLLPEAAGFRVQVEWIEPFRFDERLFAPSANTE